ncbi:unnamed protein product [Protopolystoma xenopodis]|uniref:Uncharacterized protein n=1 Tax=Protopolystoma xenopodis TaxID=117903 RepID=A0A3S5CVY4_9PLAT|nr:unnamed protein product [Protopolystoma xenopodis]
MDTFLLSAHDGHRHSVGAVPPPDMRIGHDAQTVDALTRKLVVPGLAGRRWGQGIRSRGGGGLRQSGPLQTRHEASNSKIRWQQRQ